MTEAEQHNIERRLAWLEFMVSKFLVATYLHSEIALLEAEFEEAWNAR